MKIGKDMYVSLVYDLKVDGTNEAVESITDENPLTFVFGTGFLLPEFEANVLDLEVGDPFKFTIKSDEAYGPIDEKAIIDLSKDIFTGDGNMEDDSLQVGMMIPMMTRSGNRMNGKVLEIGATTVKMDFNHPMAGKDLCFDGKVIGVRAATEEEIFSSCNPAGGCSSCGEGSSCGGSC